MSNRSQLMPIVLTFFSMLFSLSITAQIKKKFFTDKSLFDVETAFSNDSKQSGFITANLTYAAHDALVFRPRMINAIEWSNKLKGQDSTYQITWYPSFVEMSASGDLGYATGPFDNVSKIQGDSSENHGQFVTVWKKQDDGTLKFIMDFGSNALPRSAFVIKEPVYQPVNSTHKKYTKIDTATGFKNILLLEKAFNNECKIQGDLNAYKIFADEDIRFFYQRQFYVKGLNAVFTKISDQKGTHTWTPIGGTISESGELAHIYGTHVFNEDNKTSMGYYMRIWKKQPDGKWVIAVQVRSLVN